MTPGRRSRPTPSGSGPQVKPLYDELHCYVRARCARTTGPTSSGRRPPSPRTCSATCGRRSGRTSTTSSSPTRARRRSTSRRKIKARKLDEKAMVKLGESFFVSLGLDPLPATFWERSLFKKPRGPRGRLPRERVGRDLRRRSAHQDVHRAEGGRPHHHPPRARARLLLPRYHKLPILFQQGANDGFHEAIGDTIALSVTPAYLKEHRPARQGARRARRARSTS